MCNTQSSGVNQCKLEETSLSILESSVTKTRLQFIILAHSKNFILNVNIQLSNVVKNYSTLRKRTTTTRLKLICVYKNIRSNHYKTSKILNEILMLCPLKI